MTAVSPMPDQKPKNNETECLISNPFRNFKFASYLKEELIQSKRKEHELSGTADKGPFNNRVYTFVTIPQHFESFMFYGLIQCLDQLLIVYTLLPVRCLLTAFQLFFHICARLSQFISKQVLGPANRLFYNSSYAYHMYSHELRDLIRISLLLISTILLLNVDSSVAYHEIRTQSVIKIYIFFNLLEVADRLLSAICQDALDDLLHTASRFVQNPNESPSCQLTNVSSNLWRDLLLQYFFAFICLFAHCFLLLCQVTTLNVAFNSQNKSLVTVFISNNFVELKSNVFKKIGKTNLFQIACADVRERFHYAVWLFIVICRNTTDTGWNYDEVWSMLFDVVCIFSAEIAVDWVKHAFITKFNVIPSDVYNEYTVSIAYDLLLCTQGKNTSDYFDLLSRRMGLTPIPLSCLINVMLIQTVRNPGWYWLAVPLVVIMLFVVKILTNMALLSYAYRHVKAYIRAAQTTQQLKSVQQQEQQQQTVENEAMAEKSAYNPMVPSHHHETHHATPFQLLPDEKLVPVRYTGYDQPTRDDGHFLPMLLRHRRVRSESGCTHASGGPTTLPFIDSPQTNYKPAVVEPLSDVFRPRSAELWNEIGTKQPSYQPFPDAFIADYSGRSPQPLIEDQHESVSAASKSSTVHSRKASINTVSVDSISLLVQTSGGSLDDHSDAPRVLNSQPISASSFLGESPARASLRPAVVVSGDTQTPIRLCRRNRSYSIDMGIVDSYSRLKEYYFPTPVEGKQDSPQMYTLAASGNVDAAHRPTPSQAPITVPQFRKHRLRTMTESSVLDQCKLNEVDRLPLFWEYSGRSSVVRGPDLNLLLVKQPLSDIDRYSMVEGQIS